MKISQISNDNSTATPQTINLSLSDYFVKFFCGMFFLKEYVKLGALLDGIVMIVVKHRAINNITLRSPVIFFPPRGRRRALHSHLFVEVLKLGDELKPK